MIVVRFLAIRHLCEMVLDGPGSFEWSATTVAPVGLGIGAHVDKFWSLHEVDCGKGKEGNKMALEGGGMEVWSRVAM